MKKIKMSHLITLTSAIITLMCLTFLFIIANRNTDRMMEQSAVDSMFTALDANTTIVESYIKDAETDLRKYGSSVAVKSMLKNPEDETIRTDGQQYTEDFYNLLQGWEGLYTADWTSTQLSHSNPAGIGTAFRTEPDALKAWQDSMLESEDGLVNQGLFTSPTSGQLILNLRRIVYDSDGKTPLGAVGGGPLIATLGDKLEEVDVSGLNNIDFSIINYNDNTIILASNDSLVGTNLTLESDKRVASEVIAGSDKGSFEYSDGDTKYVLAYQNVPDIDFAMVMRSPASDVFALSDEASKSFAVYCVICFVLMITCVFIVASFISKPLTDITAETEKIAKGYINEEINVKSPVREITQISDSCKNLQNGLKEIVGGIRKTADNLSGEVADTSTILVSSSEGTDQINLASTELAQGATSMAGSVQDLNENMIGIGSNIETIEDAVNTLNNISEEMSRISNEAKNDIASVYDSSESSVKAVEDISVHMNELTQAIKNVSEATDLIAGIANQTKLLSLNASIEAARAGEMGKGFAVVAESIGNLAMESNDGVTQITEICNKILALSETSMKVTEEIKKIISDEQEKVSKTQESFDKLKSQIDTSIQQIENISKETQNLAVSKDSAITYVTDLSAISEQNAASTQQTAASVENLKANINDISLRAEQMKSMSETLIDAIEVFKTE